MKMWQPQGKDGRCEDNEDDGAATISYTISRDF